MSTLPLTAILVHPSNLAITPFTPKIIVIPINKDINTRTARFLSRNTLWNAIIWSTIFCVIVGLLFSLFSTTIVSQFTTGNTEMIHIGASSLRVNGITFMLFGYYTVYSSLFLALGKGKEGFILGACRQGICFIPVILIFPFIWGLNGILYAQPIADVLSALITVFMAIPLHRSLAVAEQKMKITASIPCDRQ